MPFVQTDTVTLHYETLGSGDDVVFVHGLGANLAFWYWGAARLIARRHHVIAYDLRGHGRSSMPAAGYTLDAMCSDLLALLDHLGIAHAHIVGHSYGARVALCFAGRFPTRCTSLTVVDTQIGAVQPPMRLGEWGYWPRWKQHLQTSGMNPLPTDDEVIDFRLLARLSEAAVPRLGSGVRRRAPSLAMRTRGLGERTGRQWRALLERTTAAEELNDESPLAASFVSAVRVPTLLVYGRLSHCLPSSETLLTLIPGARRIVIRNAGHFLPAVKPRLFARALSRFVNGLRLPPAAAPAARLIRSEARS
ncbi:MAG: alpha/beta hydrolase [Rhodospirillales bacterium]|jgi:pimeloyl-ACP methyl ester carboxylesterase|nr:alpha/beta hydrolase [Rhodospirillales bacterium]